MGVKLSAAATKAVQNLSAVNPGCETCEQADPGPVDYNREVDKCVADFNEAGISLMDYPKATRRRAFEIEKQFHQAAMNNDSKAFMELLRQWRECFH